VIPRRGADKPEAGGPAVQVDTEGAGDPVVFLHGLLGLNEHWTPVVERLSERYCCLRMQAPLLELRGADCSVEGATRLMQNAIGEHVDGPAVLVGNSLGGHIAMRIALETPDRVRALVLTGSSGLFERTFEKDVQHRPSKEWIEKKIRELFADGANAPDEAIDRAYQELSDRQAARALVRLSKSAKNDHMGERMTGIRTPTLLVWGRDDIVTPPRVAEEFCSLIPGARLHWIDRCGHAPMIERPDEFAGAVAAFLEDLASGDKNKLGSRQEVA
jgi:pimeloyl-ACP methyl ester carboxylesterase